MKSEALRRFGRRMIKDMIIYSGGKQRTAPTGRTLSHVGYRRNSGRSNIGAAPTRMTRCGSRLCIAAVALHAMLGAIQNCHDSKSYQAAERVGRTAMRN
jgi:hypothetical protein